MPPDRIDSGYTRHAIIERCAKPDAMRVSSSRRRLWGGWTATAICGLFLLIDAFGKLARADPAVEATVRLGYPEATIAPLGMVLAACTVLYLVPRTTLLGAILLTGYLGGAVSAHVRVGDPVFAIVFPFIMGALLWGGLLLRDARLQPLIPFTK
jgi:hypothetical protein